MSITYFTHTYGILHLLRFLCLVVLLIFAEIRIPSCGSSLNEYLGFNHSSILFYYLLIWISLAFEIYFLINRSFGSVLPQAKRSSQVLFGLLSFSYLLAAAFTLFAIVSSSDGHVITQHDFGAPSENILPIKYQCNILRLIGILLGFLISIFYSIAAVLIPR